MKWTEFVLISYKLWIFVGSCIAVSNETWTTCFGCCEHELYFQTINIKYEHWWRGYICLITNLLFYRFNLFLFPWWGTHDGLRKALGFCLFLLIFLCWLPFCLNKENVDVNKLCPYSCGTLVLKNFYNKVDFVLISTWIKLWLFRRME